MENFETLVAKVVVWADERGIFDAADPLAQLDKTQEELNETIDAFTESAFDNPEVELSTRAFFKYSEGHFIKIPIQPDFLLLMVAY